jgi:hypothetical protein
MRKFVFGIFIGCALMVTPAYAACSASASRSWISGLTIEAFAQGPSCAQAVATLVIRNNSGEALWAQAHVTSFLMNFTQPPATTGKALASTLKDWISGDGFMKSADKLVEGSEFPFTLDGGLNKDDFAKFRKAKAPLFCFIQGMESGTCLALDKDGGVVELGVQQFPG